MRLENDIVLEMSDGSTYSLAEEIEASIDWWRSLINEDWARVDYFDEGSEAYTLAAFINYLRFNDIQLAYDVKDSNDINQATGDDLDRIGLYYGILRNEGEFSTLTARLTLAKPAHERVTFYEGVEACTNDSIYFHNENNITINIGEITVDFPMTADETGSFSNILPGTLNNIVSDLGVEATITNITPGEGGLDIEEDETYRARIIHTKDFYPVWSVAWYTYLARTVSPRAKYVKEDNRNGLIYYITNEKELKDLFSIKKHNNAWIKLKCTPAAEKLVYGDVTLQVSVIKGYSTTQVVEDVMGIFEEYINDSEIGGIIDKDYLISLVYSVNGLNSLNHSELDSYTLANNEYAKLSPNFEVKVMEW